MRRNLRYRSLLKYSLAVLVMAVGFTACNDDDDITPIVHEARIGVLNLVEDVNAVDVHLDDTKINPSAVQFGVFSDYLTIDAGENPLRVFEAGGSDMLANVTRDFKANEAYSVFVLGDKENVELLTVQDDLKAPVDGKAKVRFANFAQGEDVFEFWINEEEDASASEVAYKDVEAFVEVDAGSDQVLQGKLVGSDEVVTELTDVTLDAGKTYTIYVVTEEEEGEYVFVLKVINNN